MLFGRQFEEIGRERALKDMRKDEPMAGMEHVIIDPQAARHMGGIEVLKDAGRLAAGAAVGALILWGVIQTAEQSTAPYNNQPQPTLVVPSTTLPMPPSTS